MDRPSQRRFDTYVEYRAAMLAALGFATRTLAIFDPDLRESGIENPAAIAALESLCRASPRRDAVRIVVRSIDFVERECPRLVALIGAFGHCAGVRVSSPPFRNWSRPFLVADERHLVTRFDQDRPRGKVGIDDLRSVSPLLAQFETMWISGESTRASVPLGI